LTVPDTTVGNGVAAVVDGNVVMAAVDSDTDTPSNTANGDDDNGGGGEQPDDSLDDGKLP
jgi:hypothetical protein